MNPDIQLPKYWKKQNLKCGVGLDFGYSGSQYDMTTLNDVKRAAKALAIECIIKAPHLGGFVQLGWRDRLGVLIAGRKPRLDEGNNATLDRAD